MHVDFAGKQLQIDGANGQRKAGDFLGAIFDGYARDQVPREKRDGDQHDQSGNDSPKELLHEALISPNCHGNQASMIDQARFTTA
jgi:hypothetical protein